MIRQVCAVVPYRKDEQELQDCLDHLAAQTGVQIRVLVVDNSEDPSPPTPNYSTLDIIRPGSNLGFAGACNLGIDASDTDWILILNADAFLSPNYVQACIEALEADPSCAGVCGKLTKLDDRKTIDTTGHVLYGDRRVADRGEWQRDGEGACPSGYVFSIPATAALFRASALDELRSKHGEIFDSSFFMYGEDVDLCWRLRLLGWQLRYESAAVGTHRRAISGGRKPTKMIAYDLRNRYLRMIKSDRWISFLRHIDEILLTEFRLFVYFLIHRPAVLPLTWAGTLRLLPRALSKRRRITATATVRAGQLERWFVRYDYRAVMRRPSRG